MGLVASTPERRRNALEESGVFVAGVTTRALGRGEMAVAFLNPLSPPAWLRLAVAEAVTRVPSRIDAVEADPVAGLPDVNLDTARPDGENAGHGTTGRTLARLAAIRSADPARSTEPRPAAAPAEVTPSVASA